MKNIIKLIFVVIIIIGCSKKKEHKNQKENNSINELKEVVADSSVTLFQTERIKKDYAFFKAILDYPKIIDTISFISELKKNYEIGNTDCYKINIKNYKKVKFYGSEKAYIIIETDCDFNNVMYQLSIFTENGNFVETISGYRYEFVKLFQLENPVLMNLDVTNQGNGSHEFFKMKNDRLQSMNKIFKGFPNTFDQHHDNAIFEPNELKIVIKDKNEDGFNDIVFKGQIILIQGRTKNGDWVDGENVKGRNIEYSIENPFKKATVEFVLLYDKKTDSF